MASYSRQASDIGSPRHGDPMCVTPNPQKAAHHQPSLCQRRLGCRRSWHGSHMGYGQFHGSGRPHSLHLLGSNTLPAIISEIRSEMSLRLASISS